MSAPPAPTREQPELYVGIFNVGIISNVCVDSLPRQNPANTAQGEAPAAQPNRAQPHREFTSGEARSSFYFSCGGDINIAGNGRRSQTSPASQPTTARRRASSPDLAAGAVDTAPADPVTGPAALVATVTPSRFPARNLPSPFRNAEGRQFRIGQLNFPLDGVRPPDAPRMAPATLSLPNPFLTEEETAEGLRQQLAASPKKMNSQ